MTICTHRHLLVSPQRRLLLSGAAAAAGAAVLPHRARAADPHPHTTLTPDQALDLLKGGNEGFVTDAPFRAAVGRERRVEIARGQYPFCVLVGCSDSRVPPELLFGRGLGDLFIVRVAGNTVDAVGLGSIEYAVGNLGVPLIVVLGHERCGAVAAAVEVVQKATEFPGSIETMLEPIVPSVIRAQTMQGDLLSNAVRVNVERVVERLKVSGTILSEAVAKGSLKIVGAHYDLDDGAVQFLA